MYMFIYVCVCMYVWRLAKVRDEGHVTYLSQLSLVYLWGLSKHRHRLIGVRDICRHEWFRINRAQRVVVEDQ